MIQFDKVSLGFSGRLLFENVSFTMQKGERCGLVGRNGSGKSTLFRLIDGEMEPEAGNVTVSKNYKIGYLQQHIRFTEPTLIKEAALALPPGEEELLYKAEKVLFGLGFTEEDLESAPSSFSGGYHLRLNLAKVLISEPDCLLLDEPTNYLDILSIRWLMNFLRNWPGEFILITHDRDFMDRVCTHTMGIHRGKIRKLKGSSVDFFGQIVLEEEVHEKSRLKFEKKRAQVQSFVDRFGAKATKAAQAQSKLKMLAREPSLEKLNQLSELAFSFHEAPFPGRRVMLAEELQFSYTQDPLIHDFSIEIEKGERVAIIGKNGRGKSTLLRLLGKDLTPSQGAVTFSEKTHVGYFGQTHVDRLDPRHTIEQAISLANPLLNVTEVKGIAGQMLFSGDLSQKSISVLSGGEKSRVLLGKIVAKPCNFLLLDEPTHHLDIESIEALIDALEDFEGAIVIVTHSEFILRRLNLSKIIVCRESQQSVFLGDYDTFLEKVGWEEEQKGNAVKPKRADERRERADWIAKRSAALKPISKQIEQNEQKLVKLEKVHKQDQILIENGQVEPTLIKSFGLRQKEIEALESSLYSLYEQLEQKKREFESF